MDGYCKALRGIRNFEIVTEIISRCTSKASKLFKQQSCLFPTTLNEKYQARLWRNNSLELSCLPNLKFKISRRLIFDLSPNFQIKFLFSWPSDSAKQQRLGVSQQIFVSFASFQTGLIISTAFTQAVSACCDGTYAILFCNKPIKQLDHFQLFTFHSSVLCFSLSNIMLLTKND